MRFKFLSLFAAVLLLAACETAPDTTGSTTGGGASATTSQTTATDQTTSTTLPPPEPGTQEHLLVEVGDRVFFAFDSSELNAESRQTLEALAAWLQTFPATNLVVEGHADERGTREYNLALGERRANSAASYLVALGIDPNRISTISYGEERPAVLGSNESAWARNRRAVFVVN